MSATADAASEGDPGLEDSSVDSTEIYLTLDTLNAHSRDIAALEVQLANTARDIKAVSAQISEMKRDTDAMNAEISDMKREDIERDMMMDNTTRMITYLKAGSEYRERQWRRAMEYSNGEMPRDAGAVDRAVHGWTQKTPSAHATKVPKTYKLACKRKSAFLQSLERGGP